MYKNSKIYILGLARSGYEVAKLLSKYNNEITITDCKEQDNDKVKELENLGVKVIITDNQDEYLDSTYNYVIKNPGVKLNHPVVLKAENLNIKVVNELEVAYNFLPKNVKIIGITGSNGKTTTTTLTYEILKEKYKNKVHLGGNIGYPLSSLINDIKENDILVLEIAGHQLHDFDLFKTDISIMTNLYEVHIDHFGTFEYYKQNKCRIFDHHTSSDIAIINKSNKDCYNDTLNIKSNKIYFSSSEETDLCIKNEAIYYKDEKIIDTSDIKIKGNHNYENAMCAICVGKILDVSNEEIKKVLNNFNGVEHRIEFVKTLNGRDFYNDSKSTNVKATIIALGSFKTPIILLLGGLDRKHPFDELVPYLNNVKNIICYGETKDRINLFAKENNIECKVVNNLEEATKYAYQISNCGDTILLSPACASWDQYESFEVRGTEFKQVVNNL